MSYFSRAAITIWHWICWCVATLFLALGSALVSPVVVLFFALDFIPKQESKPLTSQTPTQRKLPVLFREGSDVFVEWEDGEVSPLEPMRAKLYAQTCFETVAGAFVYEKTKLPD